MKRIYHHYKNWEDYREGMYRTTCFMDQETLIIECIATLGCPQWLEEAMFFCVTNWENSAEHNLTNTHRNRQAWLGQAACCFVHGAPEYVTKMAWHRLTEEQKTKANKIADKVIGYFELKQEIKGAAHA